MRHSTPMFDRSMGLGMVVVLLVMGTSCDQGRLNHDFGDEFDDDLDHGAFQVEFQRSSAATTDPFVGTQSIELTLHYLECLRSFYRVNPDYQARGPLGTGIFGPASEGGEGWQDRLCDRPDDPTLVTCTVQELRQELDVADQLTVEYEVSGELEDQHLWLGPVPRARLADCSESGLVRVTSGMAIGRAEDGTILWREDVVREGGIETLDEMIVVNAVAIE